MSYFQERLFDPYQIQHNATLADVEVNLTKVLEKFLAAEEICIDLFKLYDSK